MLSKTLIASLLAAAVWDTAMAQDARAATFEGLVAGFQFYDLAYSTWGVTHMDSNGIGYGTPPTGNTGVGATLTIGAASAPDALYQVRATYLNSSSTDQTSKVIVQDASGADLMKGIDITNDFHIGPYDISVYGNCRSDSCATGNLMASKLVTFEMVDSGSFHVASFSLANRRLAVTVQYVNLLSSAAENKQFALGLIDSTGKVVSQRLVSQEELGKGATIGTSTYPAGDYTVHAKGPCVASVRGSYDCSGATYDMNVAVYGPTTVRGDLAQSPASDSQPAY